MVAPTGPAAPSSVRSVSSNPPPASPARTALETPAGTWPPRPPPCLPVPPAFALLGFAAPPGGRGLRGARAPSGFAVSSAKVATRKTTGMGPGGTTGISTTSDAFVNPSWLASTRYGPAGISGNSNLPASSVQLSQVLFVSVLIKCTVAAGTGVPSGVRTTPLTGCGELAGCCAKFKIPLASQNRSSARAFPWKRIGMTSLEPISLRGLPHCRPSEPKPARSNAAGREDASIVIGQLRHCSRNLNPRAAN